jgi:periplasmic protein TonB
MLAYAASRPVLVDRRPHPNTMLLIIAAHVALVAAVMSAKMEIPIIHHDPPTKIFRIPLPQDPPPIQRTRTTQLPAKTTAWTQPKQPQVQLPPLTFPSTDPGPMPDPGPALTGGTGLGSGIPHVVPSPVRSGPQLLTPSSELKPPYPASKLLNEEEASLTLKLTIDPAGRVIAVEPVGRADSVFLDAARRYVLAHWRYKPALEDGRAVASSTVVTLRFELDG